MNERAPPGTSDERTAIAATSSEVPQGTAEKADEMLLGIHRHLQEALRIPTMPWPDPGAHGHEATARAIHTSYCALRFKVIDAIAELTSARVELTGLLASSPQPEAAPSEAEQVCMEAYQVVGSLLSDLDVFETDEAEKILDNLCAMKRLHKDVLPWPSFAQPEAAPAVAHQNTGEPNAADTDELERNPDALRNIDAIKGAARQLRKVLGVSQDFDDWPLERLILKGVERIMTAPAVAQADPLEKLTRLQEQMGLYNEAPAQAAQSAGEVERRDVVAFEFYNRATGHAIVDYSVNTHVGNLSADKGYEARPLVYAEKREEVTDGSKPIPLWQAREALDELEAAARGDAPFNHQAAAVVRAALSHKEPQR